jgi:putative transposase
MWAEEAEVERAMDWKTLLAYITGSVDQELLLRNEYLLTENRLLRQQVTGRVCLTDGERKTLAEIGKRLGKQALAAELEALVVRLAQENRSWGYDRIAGALIHLGYTISDQTVGNILKRQGVSPAPTRKMTTTWSEFIRVHMDVLVATDFFTTEIWTTCGLVTYYILFFIHLASRKVHVAGVTPHPDAAWMVQMARNITMDEWGFLAPRQYLIHDRDGKFCPVFQHTIDEAGVKRVPLPPRGVSLTDDSLWGARPAACPRGIRSPLS